MKTADQSSSYGSNRIEETHNFWKNARIPKIGIANCITFSHKTDVPKKYFSEDFEIFTADCTYGRLKKHEILGENSNRVVCNSAGQTEFLTQNKPN
ncbi:MULTISPECIES: DUF1847 domain-containing protein [unclassified Saccharicrinis]|uniref:DUF1847 domain-containing protein n=1 Tax=unclassified Saccharicrinis TaxID=2646859 RepID=UPI003D334C53